MNPKEEVLDKINKLAKKFDNLTPHEKKDYNEANTRKNFIMPLFAALGWDVYADFSKDEVIEEETSIVAGRYDYSFRINGITQFILEAKAIPEDLDKEKWAKQAVEYGWNKGIPWVVLTDFEGLKVFNSEWKIPHPKANIDLSYKDYSNKLDRLWLLSKESFLKNELDNKASEWGITAKRESVNERLAKDLISWRDTLNYNFSEWNKDKVSQEIIEESVQRILDRLIFMRVVEDKGLEEKILWQTFQKWTKKDYEPQNFIQELIPLFRQFDETYNSNLFEEHTCEKLYTTQEPFIEIIPNLYSNKEDGVKYRFDAINADVLGNVYEQYLGHVQGREGDKSKRKKQGIYYTPQYIVDYIVQNTLGKDIKEKNLQEVENIKVLDPACGSGSFLIRAFEVLNQHLKHEKNQKGADRGISALRKYNILLKNIYGVDLDSQAVEIARLNLMLAALEPSFKLPRLSDNIKNGNSLISDPKYTDKPFNWEEEYEDVMKKGGFDIIIGNPPYVSYYSKQSQANSKTGAELEYLIKKYDFIQDRTKLGRFNTLMFFIDLSIKRLKENGYIGLLLDTNLHSNPAIDIRKYLTENMQIEKIIDEFNVFKGVGSSQIIIIAKKGKPSKTQTIKWYKLNNYKFTTVTKGLQQSINKSNEYSFKFPKDTNTQKIILKIKRHKHLVEIVGPRHIRTCITFTGKKDSFVRNKPEKDIDLPLLEGSKSLPHPYAKLTYNKYVRYNTKLRDKLNQEYIKEAAIGKKRSPKVIGLGDLKSFESPKIFIRLSDNRLTSSYTPELVCADLSLYVLTLSNYQKQSDKIQLFYLLALLNSKLLSYYMKESNYIRNLGTGTPQIRLNDIRSIPIPTISFQKQSAFSNYAKSILELNEDISKLAAKSNQWQRLQTKIATINHKIDQEAYKIYGLTKEEIEIVEGCNNEKTIS